MFAILVAALLYLRFSIASTEKYDILPAIYEMDDYITCMDKNDLYCKIDIKLRNNNYENNTLWEIIYQSKNDSYSYDRSIIHRAICVPKTEAGSTRSYRNFIELRINEELKKNNLISQLEDITCTSRDFKISSYDIYFLMFLGMYIFLILYATLYDIRNRKYKRKLENTGSKVVMCFSLISNWEKLLKVDGNEDYNKLKSIQGIRVYTMLFILFLHTKLSYSMVYLSNPEYSEKMLRNSLLLKLCNLDTFLVQIFFLISSWILTFQIYNIAREQGKFTIKQAFYLSINRYFRFGVCSTVVIFLLKSSWYRLLEGPVTFDVNDTLQRPCRDNWWQTFFFLSNNLYMKDTCHPPSWYLSVDFQLYNMAIVTIYLILKLKLNERKVLSFIFFVVFSLYGLIIYLNNMDVIFRTTAKNHHIHYTLLSLERPKNLRTVLIFTTCFLTLESDASIFHTGSVRGYTILRSDSLKILYTSTYSSWTTSIVGIWLGIVYSKNKQRNIANNKVVSLLCLLTFFALPSAAVLISGKQYKGITAAILGPLVKPLFSGGIGIGILGMSHNIGGVLKRIFENKFVVLMSNFSFSIYVFQTLIIFSKGTGSYYMIEYGFTEMVKTFLFFDAPVSILAGIIGALIFEQPGINLQKMFVPQLHGRQQHKDS